jgi:hypothetical protein
MRPAACSCFPRRDASVFKVRRLTAPNLMENALNSSVIDLWLKRDSIPTRFAEDPRRDYHASRSCCSMRVSPGSRSLSLAPGASLCAGIASPGLKKSFHFLSVLCYLLSLLITVVVVTILQPACN